MLVTYLVARNLTRPFHEIIRALNRIRKGRLDHRVNVFTNDEVGFTGEAINEMVQGLKEREKMRRSLQLAHEIQQSLLPARPPARPGLEVSGRSVYCDETGGDYFDYIIFEEEPARLGLVIGDVSGHGISSALLMTGLRSYLRSRAALNGSAADIINHVNRLISADTEETGQFITLFYLEVNLKTMELTWVRAGHDPAWLFSPDRTRIQELDAPGPALGLNEDWTYESRSAKFQPGQYLVLATDGVWETMNERSEMFGKDRFQKLLGHNGRPTAEDLIQTSLDALTSLRRSAPQVDDVTMIVVRFL